VTNEIPTIERRIPAFGRWIMRIVTYCIVLPIDWLLSLFGNDGAAVRLMMSMGGKKRWKKVFDGYEPVPGDVFVSTFSKSGTNWMMQIAHQIAFRGNGDYANIHDVVSWPDMDRNRRRKMSVDLESSIVRDASPTGLRVIKTHLGAVHVPVSDAARYIVVIRDPKEVFVSSYFFASGPAGPLMPGPETWFRLFTADRFPMDFGTNWAEHTASYWALRDRENVLVLFFAEMKKDLRKAVADVARFLGVELTPEEMQEVIRKSSFDYMKGIDDRFQPVDPDSMPWGKGFTMMRSGRAGASGELLTPDQQRQIDEYFIAELERLGSDFPYRRTFAATRERNAA